MINRRLIVEALLNYICFTQNEIDLLKKELKKDSVLSLGNDYIRSVNSAILNNKIKLKDIKKNKYLT